MIQQHGASLWVSKAMKITDFYPVLMREACLSKDPRRKVCAAAFDKHLNRLASGWNGLPRKMLDLPERYNKPLKDFYVVHAEINLIASAARLGISLQNSSVLITELHPCAGCAGALAQAGVLEVYYPTRPGSGRTVKQDWLDNFEHAQTIFRETGVQLCPF